MISSVSKIQVRYSETDMMGIVYHANYLPWLEIGRTQLLKEYGFPYKELEKQGLFLPVIEISMKYLRPATYDDTITIKTVMKEKPYVKIHLGYDVLRDDDIIATGYSMHAFMNKETRPIKAPRQFLDALNKAFE